MKPKSDDVSLALAAPPPPLVVRTKIGDSGIRRVDMQDPATVMAFAEVAKGFSEITVYPIDPPDQLSKQDAIWIIKRWIKDKFGSQKKAAEHLGFSSAYLSKALNQEDNIPDALLEAAGLEKITVYRNIAPPTETD